MNTHDQDSGDVPSNRWSIHLISGALLLLAQFAAYELFPHIIQHVEFNLALRHGWYWVPWAILGYYTFRYAQREGIVADISEKRDVPLGKHRRRISVVATVAVLICIWDFAVYVGTDMLTYHTYASNFQPRDALVPSDPRFVRYTPSPNACNDLGNSISSTGEHINCEEVQPMITADGFTYVAPITPSGIINTFMGMNPGFLVLDDSAAASDDPRRRIRRLDQTQRVGQGMEWFDNLNYVLAKTDFFATFDTPHFLALDPAQPQRLTLVVPKIKYGFLFRVPYWGGNVLVHSDGTVEDLTAQQVRSDPRLAGKWVYPTSLVRRYVRLQNYAAGHGLLTPVARMSGLFEIENLPGTNQFPFLSQGSDGRPYLVTATKGQGSAQGLFRMYFIDASTGDGTYHQFNPHEVVYGARASLGRITNIPGYQWYDGKETGVAVAIEPVYIVRANDPTLYWKYTITNRARSGISATVVANASRPDEVHVFLQRHDFEAWLQGGEVRTNHTRTDEASKQRILRIIGEMEGQLRVLKSLVENSPE